MVTVDDLILGLIAFGRKATSTELDAIVQQVARAPFATYLSHVPSSVRIGLSRFGVTLPTSKVRTVEWHLRKRIYLDKQWPVDTTEAQFIADL